MDPTDTIRSLIRAYHGSPARNIRKFDPNRIGSAKNGTALGYGFNFSEDPLFARQYRPMLGKTYEVEIGYPESSLIALDERPTGDKRAALADMVYEAPSNFWRDDATQELMVGGNSQLVLESLLRAYNTEQMDRQKNLARIASELFDRQIPGARSDHYGPRTYVMYPGSEDRIRVLRKFGLAPATLGAEGLLNQQPEESMAPGGVPVRQ